MLINTGSIAQNYKGWTTDTNLKKVRVGTIKNKTYL
jgi:hypothetical protein